MSDTQITNARRGGAGVLVEIDEQVDSQGRRYPTAIVRASDGTLKALHFSEPGQIAALAKAAPAVGDRLSLSSGNLNVTRPDLYGPTAERPAAADWGKWANVAYRRDPESPSHLVADRVAPPARSAPARVERQVRMANGQVGTTFDPAPVAPQPRIVAEDGHMVTRR